MILILMVNVSRYFINASDKMSLPDKQNGLGSFIYFLKSFMKANFVFFIMTIIY